MTKSLWVFSQRQIEEKKLPTENKTILGDCSYGPGDSDFLERIFQNPFKNLIGYNLEDIP